MTATNQRRRVYVLINRLATLQIGLTDRVADGPELVEELEIVADAAEHLADDCRKLAAQLDRDMIIETGETDAAAE